MLKRSLKHPLTPANSFQRFFANSDILMNKIFNYTTADSNSQCLLYAHTIRIQIPRGRGMETRANNCISGNFLAHRCHPDSIILGYQVAFYSTHAFYLPNIIIQRLFFINIINCTHLLRKQDIPFSCPPVPKVIARQ